MTAKTDTTPYKGHFGLYVAGLFVALALLGGTTYLVLASDGRAAGWEHTWLTAVNNWPEWFYWPMWIITVIATPGALAVASVAAAFFTRYYRLAARLTLSVFGAYGITYALKNLIDRARPEEQFAHIQARMHESSAAFPSGHTTAITVVLLTLLPYMPWRWRWTVPAGIALVGLSRIYLGEHFPLDVIAGFAVSTAVVALVRVLPQSLRVALRID